MHGRSVYKRKYSPRTKPYYKRKYIYRKPVARYKRTKLRRR